jgi:predicted phosphate transport protein (TIGR00153 family)
LEQSQAVADEKLEQLTALEKRCDALQRSIETTMYTEMLIPESQGDVLNLLGDLDDLLDGFKASLRMCIVERPEFPEDLRATVSDLVKLVIDASEHTVRAARAFFRDAPTIRDSVHKVAYYEAESDEVELRLLRQVFDSDLPLACRSHLRDAIRMITVIADNAEDCGDRLTIYAIKRSL